MLPWLAAEINWYIGTATQLQCSMNRPVGLGLELWLWLGLGLGSGIGLGCEVYSKVTPNFVPHIGIRCPMLHLKLA